MLMFITFDNLGFFVVCCRLLVVWGQTTNNRQQTTIASLLFNMLTYCYLAKNKQLTELIVYSILNHKVTIQNERSW